MKRDTPKRPRGRPVGTKVPDDERKKRINISIADHHRQIAGIAGEGNVSAGIGTALDHWASAHLKKIVKGA
jgi:hypothetical protein